MNPFASNTISHCLPLLSLLLLSADSTMNICSSSSPGRKLNCLNYLYLKYSIMHVRQIITFPSVQKLAQWFLCLNPLNICVILILNCCFYWFIFHYTSRGSSRPSQHLVIWKFTFYTGANQSGCWWLNQWIWFKMYYILERIIPLNNLFKCLLQDFISPDSKHLPEVVDIEK